MARDRKTQLLHRSVRRPRPRPLWGVAGEHRIEAEARAASLVPEDDATVPR